MISRVRECNHKSSILLTTDRPELSLQLGTTTLSLQSIQEGNDIYFDCVVDASPMPLGSIVWRFNEEILEPRQGTVLRLAA